MMCGLSLVGLLFAATAASAPTISCHTEPGMPRFGAITASGIPERRLASFRGLQSRAEEWSGLLAIYTGAAPSFPDQPAVLGSYEVAGRDVLFAPRFPFLPGMTYRVRLEHGGAAAITERCTMPASPVRDRTHVEAIYPSATEVPENLLRVYVHFSAPMRGKDSHRFVRLYDSAGREVELPFVEVKEGLWDPSRRRLTLIFHPGRIKRGVGPNREMGPPLRAGETFRLVVDRQLRDFGGEPLQASFEKELRVVAADRSSPDPHSWRVMLPENSTGSLVLELGEPLDEALLERMISIEDASRRRVPGELVIGDAGTRVSFRPDAAWRPGRYTIVVSPALEDLAGNRIDRLFDEELSPSAEPERGEPLAVSLLFVIGK